MFSEKPFAALPTSAVDPSRFRLPQIAT